MITKYKIFESVYRLPKIGDYVLFDKDCIFGYSGDLNEGYYIGQLKSTIDEGYWIGNVENIQKEYNSKREYLITNKRFKECWYSENKEELENILKEKKYNL